MVTLYLDIIEKREIIMTLEKVLLPNKTKNILIKKYPNKLLREDKIEAANEFMKIYKNKIYITAKKNKDMSFREVNRSTLISILDLKAFIKNEYFKYIKEKDLFNIEKSINEHIYKLLKTNDKIFLDEDLFLEIKEGKIVISS